MTLTVGSLFSGIGGLDLGLERAGMKVVWQCEKDKDARAVLAEHWPHVPCYDDVKEISGDRPPVVDVLCGGFPCQDVSVAGRRAGLAGERSGLFHEFMRLASELAPRWVVVENVPGLLSSNDGRDMGTVLGTLADLGYGWAYRVLDSQFLGVAQRRRRVFIVGCFGDGARAASVLFEPESCDGNPPPRREAGTRVASTLEAGANSTGGTRPPGTTVDTADTLNVVATLTSHGVGTCGVDDNQAQAGHVIPCLTGRYGKGTDSDATDALLAVAFHQTQDPISDEDVTPALGATSIGMGVAYNPYRTMEKDGSVTSGFAPRPVVDALHGPTGNKEPLVLAHSIAVRGREDGQEWELGAPEVGNALRAGDGGSSRSNWALTPDLAVRRLTPLECERLQGFPDGWTASRSDSARYRLLGNAVTVNVAEWIGRRMVHVEQTA